MTALSHQAPRPRKRRTRPAYPRRLGTGALALAAALSVAATGCDLFFGNTSGDMVGPYEAGGYGGSGGNQGGGGLGGEGGEGGEGGLGGAGGLGGGGGLGGEGGLGGSLGGSGGSAGGDGQHQM